MQSSGGSEPPTYDTAKPTKRPPTGPRDRLPVGLPGGVRPGKSRIVSDADDPAWRLRQVAIPVALIVAGLAVGVGAVYIQHGDDAFAVGIRDWAIRAGLGFVSVLLAAAATWKLLGFDLGEPLPAALKLAAVYLAPAALSSIVSITLGDGPLGGFMGFIAAFTATFLLVQWLFETETTDAIVFAVIASLVRIVVVGGVYLWLIVNFPRLLSP